MTVHARPLLIQAPAPPSWFCIVCAGNCRTDLCSCSVSVPSASPQTQLTFPKDGWQASSCPSQSHGLFYVTRVKAHRENLNPRGESLLTVVSTKAQQELQIYNRTELLTSSGKMHEALASCNLCAVKPGTTRYSAFFSEYHEHGSPFDLKIQCA